MKNFVQSSYCLYYGDGEIKMVDSLEAISGGVSDTALVLIF